MNADKDGMRLYSAITTEMPQGPPLLSLSCFLYSLSRPRLIFDLLEVYETSKNEYVKRNAKLIGLFELKK